MDRLRLLRENTGAILSFLHRSETQATTLFSSSSIVEGAARVAIDASDMVAASSWSRAVLVEDDKSLPLVRRVAHQVVAASPKGRARHGARHRRNAADRRGATSPRAPAVICRRRSGDFARGRLVVWKSKFSRAFSPIIEDERLVELRRHACSMACTRRSHCRPSSTGRPRHLGEKRLVRRPGSAATRGSSTRRSRRPRDRAGRRPEYVVGEVALEPARRPDGRRLPPGRARDRAGRAQARGHWLCGAPDNSSLSHFSTMMLPSTGIATPPSTRRVDGVKVDAR